MSIISLLSELGSQMGLGDLRPNEQGVCRLVFDQKLKVDIEASEDGKSLLIYTKLGDVPRGARASFYRMLLDANLFGRGTGGGASLALDGDMGEVFLQNILPLDNLDVILLASTLEDFLNIAETWLNYFETNEFPDWNDGLSESGDIKPAAELSSEDIALGGGPASFIRA